MTEENKEEEVVEEGNRKKPNRLPAMTNEEVLELFKSLTYKSLKQIGREKGFDNFFDSSVKMAANLSQLMAKVKKAPEIYGISKDAVALVQEAMESRNIRKNPRVRSEVAIQTESFRDKLDEMRDKTASMIMKKLEGYDKTKKSLDGISIRDLKDLLSTAIDKGRLLRGESTENIVKMAKIDTDNLKPEDALAVIMKAREVLIEGKK